MSATTPAAAPVPPAAVPVPLAVDPVPAGAGFGAGAWRPHPVFGGNQRLHGGSECVVEVFEFCFAGGTPLVVGHHDFFCVLQPALPPGWRRCPEGAPRQPGGDGQQHREGVPRVVAAGNLASSLPIRRVDQAARRRASHWRDTDATRRDPDHAPSAGTLRVSFPLTSRTLTERGSGSANLRLCSFRRLSSRCHEAFGPSPWCATGPGR